MKTCYIVGAGEVYEPIHPKEGDLVIAADGGYDSLVRMGVGCDLLIGDLDSISEPPTGLETLRHPVRKDKTDSHLAYLEGVKRGYTSFHLSGVWGGREDHSLANIALALTASRSGHEMVISGELSDMFVITDGECEIEGEVGRRFSVLAINGAALGVSISGAEYDVDSVTLTESFPLGVSNALKEKIVKISVAAGSLLIIAER